MRQKTQEEKEMQGTFEPSKENFDPVELETWDGSRMPAANSEWPPNIQKIWNERCKDLFKAGYLAKAFLPALERYCFAILQAETAETRLLSDGFISEEIGTKGQVYEIPSKWIQVLDNANKTIDKFGAKFGFTPLDIQKIPVVRKAEEVKSLLK